MAYDFLNPNKKKITFVGEHSAGKTSIIMRYIYDEFNESYKATIGIDFLSHVMRIKDHQTIHLQIWDTAGQERFKSEPYSFPNRSLTSKSFTQN